MKFTETNAGYVRKLADLLIECPIEGRITYEDMSNAIGFNVKSKGYIIQVARARANTEVGAIFINVPGVGYDRLRAESAHSLGATARGHIRRKANHAIRQMENAISKANDVSNEARLRTAREQSMLGLVSYVSKDRSVHPAKEGSPPPPTAETIRAFIEAQRSSGLGK